MARIWFRQRAAGPDVPPMYPASAGKDADFDDAEASQAPADFGRLRSEWQSADESVKQMDFGATFEAGHGERWSLRMMYVHLIGEYARHNGHADLLREAIDGVTAR